MTKSIAFRSLVSRCCVGMLALSLFSAMPAFAANNIIIQTPPPVQAIAVATTGLNYTLNAVVNGLQAPNGTHDFSVNAWGICRYIDVGTVPGGNGLLIPFNTSGEWIKGAGNTGFIATNATNRAGFVSLDFCRPAQVLGPVDFGGAGGLSIYQPSADPVVVAGNARTAISPLRTQPVADAAQKRIDTRDPAAFTASLVELRPHAFSLSRDDCLGNTTYPDGSIRNPCFTWNWQEEITATFTDNISKTLLQAQADASAVPVQAGTNVWSYTLARTACIGSNAISNDGHTPLPNSCPPAVQAPILGACAPNAHNTHYMGGIVSTGNIEPLTCQAGYSGSKYRTYDEQARLWCFDQVAYPDTPTTVQINSVIHDNCQPVINGQVGLANGQSFDGLPANDGGLCTVGAVDAFTATATGWSWTCKGSNGGSDAYGTANQRQAYNLACNVADSSLGGGGTVSFSCDKFNSSNNTCAGTQSATGVSGCCKAGQPNNQPFSVFGTTVNGCDAPAPTCTVATGNTCDNGTGTLLVDANNAITLAQCQSMGGNCVVHQAGATQGYGAAYSWNFYACIQGATGVSGTSDDTSLVPNFSTQNTGYSSLSAAAGCFTGQPAPAPTPPVTTCTAHTEDQTVPCGSGYTGNKVQRRMDDQGNVCGSNGAWADYDTSACVPAPTYQTEPFDRDYDGWVITNVGGQEIKMCDRISIQAWVCNGYADCTVDSLTVHVNSGAVCQISGTRKFTHEDATVCSPISYNVFELMNTCPSAGAGGGGGGGSAPSLCGGSPNSCSNGGTYDNDGTSESFGGGEYDYDWSCSAGGGNMACHQHICPSTGCQ